MTTLIPIVLPEPTSELGFAEPGTAGARPFGLSFASTVPANEREPLAGLRYDEWRQVTITADGSALAEQPMTAGSTTPTDTRYDSTWVVDQTPVD